MENETIGQTVAQRMEKAARSMFGAMARGDGKAFSRMRSRARDGLGTGVRACQLYFAALLACALAYALATAPSDFAYDFSLVHGFATAALASIAVWLFQKRAAAARMFGVAAALACDGLSLADMFLFGAYDVVAARVGAQPVAVLLAVQYALAAAACIFLATSSKARRVLSRPLDHAPVATHGHSFDAPLKQRVRTWVFWRDLLMLFFAFSFLGHWAEMLFCYNIYTGLFMGDVDFSEVMLWKQWLFPYCAEGVAVVLIAVLLTPIKQRLLARLDAVGPEGRYRPGRLLPAVALSIVVTAAVCTAVDFTSGMICNQNYEVWDYRALPFNFMGQVCLQNSTVYTVAASLILWVFYPLMDRGLRRMPRFAGDALFFALLGAYAFSALLHFMYVGDAGLVVGAFEM